MRTIVAMLTLLLGMASQLPANAAALKVAPVSLSVSAPAAATTLRLTNAANRPANVQIRVFRWSQTDGKDQLEPTRDVVVSPPIAALGAGAQQTVRVVRIAKSPISSEESYRLIVDSLPQPGSRKNGTVSFLLRYSIPLFFVPTDTTSPRLAWSVRYDRNRFVLSAANLGATREKITGIRLRDADGVDRRLADGLVGYVLGESSMNWRFGPAQGGAPIPGPAVLQYRSDSGTVDVPVDLRLGD